MSNDSLKEMDKLLDQLEAKLATVNLKPSDKPELMGVTLPMTTTICHKVDSSALAMWAAEQLGIPSFEFVDMDNDTDHDFDASTRHNPKYTWSWNQDEIDATIDAAKSNLSLPIHEAGNLLSYFADAGLIPEGNYIVNVSW